MGKIVSEMGAIDRKQDEDAVDDETTKMHRHRTIREHLVPLLAHEAAICEVHERVPPFRSTDVHHYHIDDVMAEERTAQQIMRRHLVLFCIAEGHSVQHSGTVSIFHMH